MGLHAARMMESSSDHCLVGDIRTGMTEKPGQVTYAEPLIHLLKPTFP